MTMASDSSTAGAANPAVAAMIALNVLALFAVSAVLAAAFYLEFAYDELPCPLCLLQRIALCGIAAGLILNLRFGLSPRHYGLILLAAASGGVFAVRQILLHIAPGDPGYGSTVLGWHFYTWSAVVFAVAILGAAIGLLFDEQFRGDARRRMAPAAVIAIVVAIGLAAANVVTTFLECGVHVCPDNPVTFELLGRPS